MDMKVMRFIFLGCAFSMVNFAAHGVEVKNETLPNSEMNVIGDIIFTVNVSREVGIDDIDLDDKCMTCLCQAATGCDLNYGCKEGYCGPFRMSRVYWIDAGKPTLPNDDANSKTAYQNCATSYPCAVRVVKGYLSKFARDCNGDGVTNCYDYAMTNGNGAWGCETPLNRTEQGQKYLYRLESCLSGNITNS